jgi:hypothetical protein
VHTETITTSHYRPITAVITLAELTVTDPANCVRDSVDGYITKTKQGKIHYDMLMLLYRPNLS